VAIGQKTGRERLVLRREGSEADKVITKGYLIAVEMEPNVKSQLVLDKLAGALTFVEGVDKVSVEELGLIDVYEAEPV
jgi:hypothetical protein